MSDRDKPSFRPSDKPSLRDMNRREALRGRSTSGSRESNIVSYIESINLWKDVHNWVSMLRTCIHVEHGQEYYFQFAGQEWIACYDCVKRLRDFLVFFD